jgi:sRNA-binding protein
MAEVKKLSLEEGLGALKETQDYQKAVLKQEKKKEQEEAERKAKVLKRERLWEALNWLSSTYAKCFNSRSPKPLKIEIDQDILSHGEWPYSKTFLGEVLAFYVGSPYYQYALLREEKRVSLEGEPIQEITDYQRIVARQRLKRIKAKKKSTLR